MRTEGGRRADDRAEVARVGDVVERDDQRRLAGVGAPARAGRRGARTRTAAPAGSAPGASARRRAGRARCAAPRAPAATARSRGRRPAARARRCRSARRRSSAVAGICAVSDSTTELRPTTYSGPPLPERPRPDAGRLPGLPDLPAVSARLAADRARRAAGCLSRSDAFGVGPRPFSCLRRCPPLPTVGPFLPLRIAPLRSELPAISSPRAVTSERRLRCPRSRCRLPRAGRGSRRRSRSPCGPAPAARAPAAPVTSASTTSCSSTPPELAVGPLRGRAGRGRARRASRAPTPSAPRVASSSPAASAVLPSRTVSWTAASAAGRRGRRPSPPRSRRTATPGAVAPTRSAACRTNDSIRRKPAPASCSASSLNSMCER